MVHPSSISIVVAEREANVKLSGTRPPARQTRSATEELLLNRVSQSNPVGNDTTTSEGLREATEPCCLIFGLIRLRSSKFIGISINTTVHVTNVDVIR
jgi:hypothetical protein